MQISVIIPTYNEAGSIKDTLAAVSRLEMVAEIIVVDGDSLDETVRIATAADAKVIRYERGRGVQMSKGVEASVGDVLWFLHADSTPPEGSDVAIAEAFADPNVVGGNFNLIFDGNSAAARFMTWLYPKLRYIGLLYGDSGIFCRRTTYDEVGGFSAIPLFEDLEVVQKLKRKGTLITLPNVITTSSRRFEGRSFLLTFVRWCTFQVLYWLGVNPHRLARQYKPLRAATSAARPPGQIDVD